MKKLTLLLALLFLFVTPAADAQSANYRAQARYYSAKRAYEGGQYNDAARMLLESRGLLGGKSNERLQYLLVLSLQKAGRFRETQAEIKRFFDLLENRELRENYTEDVDRMTADEVRQITMLLDEVDQNVASDTEGKAALAARRARAVAAVNEMLRASDGARVTYRGTVTFNGKPHPATNVYTYSAGPLTPEPSGRYSLVLQESEVGRYPKGGRANSYNTVRMSVTGIDFRELVSVSRFSMPAVIGKTKPEERVYDARSLVAGESTPSLGHFVLQFARPVSVARRFQQRAEGYQEENSSDTHTTTQVRLFLALDAARAQALESALKELGAGR